MKASTPAGRLKEHSCGVNMSAVLGGHESSSIPEQTFHSKAELLLPKPLLFVCPLQAFTLPVSFCSGQDLRFGRRDGSDGGINWQILETWWVELGEPLQLKTETIYLN